MVNDSKASRTIAVRRIRSSASSARPMNPARHTVCSTRTDAIIHQYDRPIGDAIIRQGNLTSEFFVQIINIWGKRSIIPTSVQDGVSRAKVSWEWCRSTYVRSGISPTRNWSNLPVKPESIKCSSSQARIYIFLRQAKQSRSSVTQESAKIHSSRAKIDQFIVKNSTDQSRQLHRSLDLGQFMHSQEFGQPIYSRSLLQTIIPRSVNNLIPQPKANWSIRSIREFNQQNSSNRPSDVGHTCTLLSQRSSIPMTLRRHISSYDN